MIFAYVIDSLSDFWPARKFEGLNILNIFVGLSSSVLARARSWNGGDVFLQSRKIQSFISC